MSKKRKLNKKGIIKALLLIIVLVGFSSFLYYSEFIKIDSFESMFKPKNEIKEINEKPLIEDNSISMIMVGDCLIHSAIYQYAKEGNTYNFNKMIDLVKPIIKEYDLAFYNQESIIGGKSIGLSTYPRFNSPEEIGDTFVDAGFNLVSLANNHTLDRGTNAIRNSLAYWKTKEGVMTAGSYSSEKERITPNIMEKNGITYALLAYTTTTNGLNVPKNEPYLITTFDKEKVKEDVERLRDKVDLLIVSMHWGEEYTHTPTAQEVEIANYLASLNVDIVIGHHPHVIQPITFINNTMVIYSLGNFISSQNGTDQLTGLMASINIRKVTINGESKITLENPKAELVYTYKRNASNHRLYTYSMLNDNLLNNYKSEYNRLMNIVTSMSEKITPVGL